MPEILRLLYKHYGGYAKFSNWSLMNKCISHAIGKEAEIPKLISELLSSFNFATPTKKKMRSARDILKDYELGGE